MVTILVDEKSLQVPAGISVLQAAQQNNIYIPTLCNHPQLRSVGACRLCVVEIDGMRGLPTACTTTVAPGMTVRTNTPAVQELRREVLSLILSEHPYTCLVCGRHERCQEWQGTIRKAGVTTGCENCPKNGQCELQVLVDKVGLSGMPYPISYRGLPVEQKISFFDRDYNLCILCGRCIRACQDVRHNDVLTFTLRGSDARVGTAFNVSHLELDCEFCGACVDVCPTGALFDKRTKWEGVPNSQVTTVCPYCSAGCQLDLWLKNGHIVGVRPNDDGAVNAGQACVRGRFGLIDIVHAPDRLRSPMLRKAVQAGKIADGSDEERLAPTSWDEALGAVAGKLAAYKGDAFAMLVSPHLTNESLYALQKFARQVMQTKNIDSATGLARSAVNELQIVPRAKIQEVRDARCIVLIGSNPRESHPIVGMYIRQAQAQGARLIVLDPRETDLAQRADLWLRPEPGTDAEWIAELTKQIKRKTPKKVGSPQEAKLAAVAQLMRENSPTMIIYGSGVTDHPTAPKTLRVIQQLADACKPTAGVLPLIGAANARAALSAGLIANEGDRSYGEIIARIASGEIKALYLVGEVPPLPILERLEYLVVQDILPSSNLEEYADAVLPATTFAEMSGALTNLEGRVQQFDAAIRPIGQSQPDWWICSQIAERMGANGFHYQLSTEILSETNRERASGAVPTSKKAKVGELAATSRKYPFQLITERNQFAYRSGSLTERIKGMNQIKQEDLVTLHPADAERLDIQEGDLIRLVSAHGSDTAVAHVSDTVLRRMVYASINPLAGSDLFAARMPETKACPVNLEKVKGKP